MCVVPSINVVEGVAGEQGEEGKEDGEEPPCLDAGSEHQIENAEKDLTNRDEISFGHLGIATLSRI